MGRGLGIAAFVVLLLSLPIPIVGNYISLLALLILCGAAFAGEKVWVVVTTVVAAIKMFFLSPSWHLMMFSTGYAKSANNFVRESGYADPGTLEFSDAVAQQTSGINTFFLLLTIGFLAAPIVIMIIKGRGRVALAS